MSKLNFKFSARKDLWVTDLILTLDSVTLITLKYSIYKVYNDVDIEHKNNILYTQNNEKIYHYCLDNAKFEHIIIILNWCIQTIAYTTQNDVSFVNFCAEKAE